MSKNVGTIEEALHSYILLSFLVVKTAFNKVEIGKGQGFAGQNTQFMAVNSRIEYGEALKVVTSGAPKREDGYISSSL